jgi:2-keto-4-pentenoate hydratase/2-oxohepta-3-ene-1,7-dioic acid hydratase in catechol pathway
MKLGRAALGAETWLVRIEGGGVVPLLRESRHPAADVLREALAADVDLRSEAPRRRLDDVALRAPVANPSKFLGVGLNYRAHARESAMAVPERPILFAKTSNAIVGPTDDIIVRAESSAEVDFEVELAVVIGTRARNVSVEEALSVVLGFTVCNDVTARDAQFSDGQWVRSKSFDTFAPLGPWIVTLDEIGTAPVRLRTVLNGLEMQDGSTDDMIFDPARLVSYISSCMTLEPGDVITTGTPPGVGFARTPPLFLQHGDVVSVEVAGIGACVNHVRFE